ncbi:tRNA dimethylallyltransferase, mitochondrial, partial [Tieghemiomyces parasiticus]
MYRGFDIITNKVTPDECDGVPHHLLDHLAVDQEYTVADFERDALAKIAEIHARDRLPILVGGTHYYLQAVLWRQSLVSGRSEPVAASSPPPRSTFPDLHAMDNTNLHALLQELDPVVARRWHPNDRRKVLRSLEVLRDTGRPHSDWMQETQAASGQAQRLRFNTCILWIHAAKDALDPRLDARVDEMVQRGLYNELRSLRRLRSTAAGTDSPRDYTHGILQAI